jgi:hypothetical protein
LYDELRNLRDLSPMKRAAEVRRILRDIEKRSAGGWSFEVEKVGGDYVFSGLKGETIKVTAAGKILKNGQVLLD